MKRSNSISMHVSARGAISIESFDPQHRLSIELDGVLLDNPQRYRPTAGHAAITYGPGPVDFALRGGRCHGIANARKGDACALQRDVRSL